MTQKEVLSNGSAHIEVQIGPTLIEYAINKFLLCEHYTDPDTGQIFLQTSYCVHEMQFIEGDDLPWNTLLLRIPIGIYSHDEEEHLYVTLIILTLRVTIEEGRKLRISKESLYYPPGWEEPANRVNDVVIDLLSSLDESPNLPEELGGVQIKIYMLKRIANGHALLGVGIVSDYTEVNETDFHNINQGLFDQADKLWAISLHTEAIEEVINKSFASKLNLAFTIRITFPDIINNRICIFGSGIIVIEDCPIHCDCHLAFVFNADSIDEYLTGNLFISIGRVEEDDLWCLARPENIVEALILGFFRTITDLPIVNIFFSAFVRDIVQSFSDFLLRLDIYEQIDSNAFEISDGEFKMSLAKILEPIGSLFWPLRPQYLDFGYTVSSIRYHHITILGDLGDVPDHDPDIELHPAYQCTASQMYHISPEFQANRAITGKLHADYKTVRLENRTSDGLLAICGWEIMETENSSFTHAFSLVSNGDFAGTKLIMPGSSLSIGVQFGPSVYDEELNVWWPAISFPKGTEFQALLRVTYITVTGNYTLAHEVHDVPLKGVVVNIEYDLDWQAGVRLRFPYGNEWIEVAEVWESRFTDPDWWLDPFPQPEPDPLDRVLMYFTSSDPGLEKIDIFNEAGELLASVSGAIEKEISLVIHPDKAYRLDFQREQDITRNVYQMHQTRLLHTADLEFFTKITDILHFGNFLAIASGCIVKLYDILNIAQPKLLASHNLHCKLIKLCKFSVGGRIAFLAVSRNRIQVIAPPAFRETNSSVLEDISITTPSDFLDIGVIGDQISLITKKGIEILTPTDLLLPQPILLFSEHRFIHKAAVGSRWVVVAGESELIVVDIFRKKDCILAQYPCPYQLDKIDVKGEVIYLHEHNGGTVVLCLSDLNHPMEIARYNTPHFTRKFLVSGHQAFSIDNNGKSVHCYRTVWRPVNREYFTDRKALLNKQWIKLE
jgi:hypothetical protein